MQLNPLDQIQKKNKCIQTQWKDKNERYRNIILTNTIMHVSQRQRHRIKCTAHREKENRYIFYTKYFHITWPARSHQVTAWKKGQQPRDWVNTNISPASFHLIHPHIPPPTDILTNLHHNTVPEHMPHHLSCPT